MTGINGPWRAIGSSPEVLYGARFSSHEPALHKIRIGPLYVVLLPSPNPEYCATEGIFVQSLPGAYPSSRAHAMLDSNQRPPPCKGKMIISQTFVVVQISLQIDVFPPLGRCYRSPLFAWDGVLIV